MTHFILIHGSWHAGWCWKLLADRLREHGHIVLCLDLPGHGSNSKPCREVTYDDYYSCLKAAVMDAKEPVILLAHSMSGIIACPLLEEIPDKIAHLYLLAAYVPQDGKSLLDMAMSYSGSAIPNFVENDSANGLCRFKKEGAKAIFYNECPEAIQDWATEKLQDQPIYPLFAPIHTHYSKELSHKRTYIITENDIDVVPDAQKDMAESCPCTTISIKTGHFPFLSHPEIVEKIITASTRQ